MQKKETDSKNIINLLKSEHFGNPGITTPDAGDPVTETTMVLTLDQLVEYDGNPRKAPNSEYRTLKASYLKTGAGNTLLLVTKRPGEEFYFPAAGGNTRLRVLRELWDELGDERFYRIHCKFIPFRDETRVLVDHLSENVNRGDYIFIDHAKGVIEVYEQMKREHGGTLSYREFIRMVGDLGYSLALGQLSRFQTAVDLYELIPEALDAGMNDHAVRLLRKTQDDLKSFLDSACGVNTVVAEKFGQFWDILLQDLDSPEGVDLDVLVDRIFESLGPIIADRISDLDDGQIVARLKHLWPQWRKDRNLSVSLRQGSVRRREDPDPRRKGPAHHYGDDEMETFAQEKGYSGNTGESSGHGLADGFHESAGSHSPMDERASTTPPVQGNVLSPPDHAAGTTDSLEEMKRNMDRFYQESSGYARLMAESWGFADLFHPIDFGFGYFVDLPEPNHSMDSLPRIAWWLLWDISGIAGQPSPIPMYLDDIFKGTRIAQNYLAVADGRASVKKHELDTLPPDRRKATILRVFKNVVNSAVQRSDDHAGFLILTDSARYDSLTRFLDLQRKAHRIKFSIAEELKGQS